jgi:hypothetical protein
MPEEETSRRYRLTLDFDVLINTEILELYNDEDDLEDDEKRKLQAARSLMQTLLGGQYRYLFDELIRKRVLEEAAFEVEQDDVKEAARVRDLAEDVLLEPARDSLSVEDQTFFQEASENKRFGEDAEDVVNSIGVELVRAFLHEVEDEGHWPPI